MPAAPYQIELSGVASPEIIEAAIAVPNLPSGTYRIVIRKEGFAASVREPVEVRPAVKRRVDITLQPGSVSQSVTVTGGAPLLNVSATSNASGIQANLIENLPLIVSGTPRAAKTY